MPLDDYLSEAALILHLCRMRLQEANRRSEWGSPVGFQCRVSQFLPPRRQWNQFRLYNRVGFTAERATLHSLLKATHRLRAQDSEWANQLGQLLTSARRRALGSEAFAFSPPETRALHKKGNEYRPVSSFGLEDKLVDAAVARYLRDRLDAALDQGAMAFRAKPQSRDPMPSTTTALNRLLTKREASLNRPVFVAECDIKAFFDCVSHDVARAQFERLASQNPEQIDPRAIRIFNAFLDSYSFQENVRQRLLPEFKRKFPNGVIKWPEPELRKLHGDVAGKRIGVPQGGALSGLIANLVLDLADRRVRAAIAQSDDAGGEYLRYCDDMILVTTSERSCQQAFDAYLAALVELKLPYHPPKRVVVYGAAFWNGKSRQPYCWSGRKWFNCVPWIQFVGYQIRYDGLLRIRKTSVQKQALKLVGRTGKIIASLGSSTQFSRESALASLSGRLSAMSVGLASGNARIDGPRPLCWAKAFRGLHKRPLVAGPLRMLDHIRRRQISRFKRKQITYGDQQRPQGWGGQPLRVRRRGSFVGQFKNKGGQNLIRNPYRADQQEKKWREPVYLFVSKVWNWFSR